MTLQEMIAAVPTLTLHERKQLMHALVDSIAAENGEKPHSALEFAGIGKELYDGVDAQEQVSKLRNEWSHRE